MLSIISMLKALSSHRETLKLLIERDFKARYAGSTFGMWWSIIQPLTFMLTLLLVFTYGLKPAASESVSFASWFFAGLIAWNFMSESISSSSNVFVEYSYLVSKMNFRIGILPLVKVSSSLLIHLVFVAIVGLIVCVDIGFPGGYILQLTYFAFCGICLSSVVSLLVSSFTVIFRDLGHLVNVLLNLGFWVTPIVWSELTIPGKLRTLLIFNPFYYVIKGYRQSLVHLEPFWADGWVPTIGFWSFILVLGVIARLAFLKLRPQFADLI